VTTVHLEPRIVVGGRLPIGIRASMLEVRTAPEAVALGHLAPHVDDLPIPGQSKENSANHPQGRELLDRRFFGLRRHAQSVASAGKAVTRNLDGSQWSAAATFRALGRRSSGTLGTCMGVEPGNKGCRRTLLPARRSVECQCSFLTTPIDCAGAPSAMQFVMAL
jgi:hypothetical protein